MSAPAAASRFDLATAAGRRRAWSHLLWTDHGFIRAVFSNLHWLSPEMARANQPSPAKIAAYAQRGVRTIINLRGADDSGAYLLEQEACARHGLTLVDFRVKSREAPRREVVRAASALFETIAYPAVMHCKSGADRAGLMSALYLHFRRGESIEAALRQLSLRYGHIRQGKTGVLDHFFACYLREGAPAGLSLLAWVEEAYDPAVVKAGFLSRGWANVLVDGVLRRE